MPNRILRDWTDSDKVNKLTAEGERFFTRLIMKVDDYGHFPANPRLLTSLLFPLKDGIRDADSTRWLREAESAGLILVYTVGGQPFIEIVNFKQQLRLKKPKYPLRICNADDEQMPSICEQPSFRIRDPVVDSNSSNEQPRAREQIPHFASHFLPHFPPVSSKGIGTAEAEREWGSWTAEQRAKSIEAVKLYRAWWEQIPPGRTKQAQEKPLKWLENFKARGFEPDDSWAKAPESAGVVTQGYRRADDTYK